jgi:hypothetical protein
MFGGSRRIAGSGAFWRAWLRAAADGQRFVIVGSSVHLLYLIVGNETVRQGS